MTRIDFSAFPILKLLSHQGPMRLCSLAQVLGLDASTVSRHARQLEDRGLLERTGDPDDGRASRVTVSQKGASCLAQGFETRRLMISQALDGWTDAERDTLRALLHRLVERLMTDQDARRTGDPPMTPDTNGYLSHKQILVVMGGLMTGMFLAALDQSIVGTALPRITSELGGLDKLSWVVTAYMLTATASTPLWGKISDLYGRRLLFQIAIVTFVVGSLLAGFSQNMEQLIAFRAIQGLGGGGLMSLALAVIGDIIPPRERGRVPGLLRGRLRHVVASSAPCWAASSPRGPGGSGSSSSTSPSASSRWSSPRPR